MGIILIFMARTYLKFLWIVEWDAVHHMTVWNFSITVSLKSTRKKQQLANRLKLTGIIDNALRNPLEYLSIVIWLEEPVWIYHPASTRGTLWHIRFSLIIWNLEIPQLFGPGSTASIRVTWPAMGNPALRKKHLCLIHGQQMLLLNTVDMIITSCAIVSITITFIHPTRRKKIKLNEKHNIQVIIPKKRKGFNGSLSTKQLEFLNNSFSEHIFSYNIVIQTTKYTHNK